MGRCPSGSSRITTFGDAFSSPVAWGLVLGLLLGKTIGITLLAWLAVRTGVATLPAGVGWRTLYVASWLGGIGFTMALFVAGLAFADTSLIETAKAGVLDASAIAGIVGYGLLLRLGRRTDLDSVDAVEEKRCSVPSISKPTSLADIGCSMLRAAGASRVGEQPQNG